MPPRIWTTRAPFARGMGRIDPTVASSAALHEEMPTTSFGLSVVVEVERRGGPEVADNLVLLVDAVDDDRFTQSVGGLPARPQDPSGARTERSG